MKKIDILNFITDFRKSPNNIRTYSELVTNLKPENEMVLINLLSELQQTRVIRESEKNGEKAYQVVTK